MTTYLVTRKPPSFPARDNRTVAHVNSVATALAMAQEMSGRNRSGSYGVAAVEGTRLVRGATFAAGELVAIGQEPAVRPWYAWDWSS